MRDWQCVLGVAAVLMVTQVVAADERPGTADPEALCLRFIQAADHGGVPTAVTAMSQDFFLSPAGRATLRQRLGLQLSTITPQYPRPSVASTYDVVASTTRGPRIARYDIVAEYERQVLVWRCIAYRVHETWRVQSVDVSADLDALFD